jgi:hypothetical protein
VRERARERERERARVRESQSEREREREREREFDIVPNDTPFQPMIDCHWMEWCYIWDDINRQ